MERDPKWFVFDRQSASEELVFWGYVLAYLVGFAAVLASVAACSGVL